MTSWRPILHGAEAERAWTTIHAVVDSLRPTPDFNDPEELTLAHGQAGVALLFAAVARATQDATLGELAVERLSQVTERARDRLQSLSPWTGLTGIAWTVARVCELLELEADDDSEDEILDDAILRLLERPPETLRFDHLEGITGLGAYALERGARPSAIACVERVVDVLDRMAQRVSWGATWHTTPARIGPGEAEIAPGGYYALGIARGSAGPLALLAAACGRGIGEAVGPSLLEPGVAWLLDMHEKTVQRRRDGAAPQFPSSVAGRRLSRGHGWCAGDAGLAVALYAIGRATRRADWQRKALELLRAPDATAHTGPMMCHGAAGVAHLLNRLYQETDDPSLQGRASSLFLELLKMSPWIDEDPDAEHLRPSVGLLDGSAGAALALLAAITDEHPNWDRLFDFRF
jgi:hypothetical protein